VIAYLDSSVLLRIILEQPDSLHDIDTWEWMATSTLTRVECLRAIDNAWVSGAMDADESAERRRAVFAKLRGVARLPVSAAIFSRAEGGFPTPVAALDAVHVATALLWRERRAPDLAFATHDRQQARAAAALGFEVIGV
jgi:predicted nucleic acid-binding protein